MRGRQPTHQEMDHKNDLRQRYHEQMQYHGCGLALFQPISIRDIKVPCCGFFDRNGDWNLICQVSHDASAQSPQSYQQHAPPTLLPLRHEPVKMKEMEIAWEPKTSQDVGAYVLGASGDTPDNLPAGANVKIKYSSSQKFGAVLMTMRPVTLTAYNDERLFVDWMEQNKAALYAAYKYGLWVITRTYSAPGASINAWMDNAKQSVVSLKAKAAMLGELGNEASVEDKLLDRDWTHYRAKDKDDGIVVFLDGIEAKPLDWWLEGVKQKISPSRGSSLSPAQRDTLVANGQMLSQVAPLKPSLHRHSQYLTPPQDHRRHSYSGREHPEKQVYPDEQIYSPSHRKSSASRAMVDSGYGDEGYGVYYPTHHPIDEETLKDAGVHNLSRRSASLRRPGSERSYTSGSRSSSPRSTDARNLRRETRSILGLSDDSSMAQSSGHPLKSQQKPQQPILQLPRKPPCPQHTATSPEAVSGEQSVQGQAQSQHQTPSSPKVPHADTWERWLRKGVHGAAHQVAAQNAQGQDAGRQNRSAPWYGNEPVSQQSPPQPVQKAMQNSESQPQEQARQKPQSSQLLTQPIEQLDSQEGYLIGYQQGFVTGLRKGSQRGRPNGQQPQSPTPLQISKPTAQQPQQQTQQGSQQVPPQPQQPGTASGTRGQQSAVQQGEIASPTSAQEAQAMSTLSEQTSRQQEKDSGVDTDWPGASAVTDGLGAQQGQVQQKGLQAPQQQPASQQSSFQQPAAQRSKKHSEASDMHWIPLPSQKGKERPNWERIVENATTLIGDIIPGKH